MLVIIDWSLTGHAGKLVEDISCIYFILFFYFSRYISQNCFDEAIEIVHNGACLFLKHKQVTIVDRALDSFKEFYIFNILHSLHNFVV